MSMEQMEQPLPPQTNMYPENELHNTVDESNMMNDQSTDESKKHPRSSLKGTFKNKIMQIFKPHSNNNDNSMHTHDTYSNTQAPIQTQTQTQQSQTQTQSHDYEQSNDINNKHSGSKLTTSMHGARTKERLASLAAMQKNKPRENRHSIGVVDNSKGYDNNNNVQNNYGHHQYHASNNNNSNNNNNNNNSNEYEGYINKRYSLDVNLKKQEQERKMLQQKAKEQQRRLMQQRVEEIKEQQQQQTQTQMLNHYNGNGNGNNNNGILEENVFPETYDNSNEQKDMDNNHNHNHKDAIVAQQDDMAETKSTESPIAQTNEQNQNSYHGNVHHSHQNSSIMEVDSVNNTPNGKDENENENDKQKKKKKVTYRLSNEKFVVYDYYQITKILGQGAYAVVAEAIDKRNGQKVAVKKNKGVFSSLSDAKRILREIKLLLHFDHDNIISLIGVIPPELHEREDFEEVYLIMPRMETTLSRVIRSRQTLTEKHKQYFIYQLLCGLHYIHSAGVLHRDLKPENILINGGDCKLKITDFGLARGVLKETDQKLTEYVVTRWYRAPEVMCSSRRYDEGVDIWSVGCIMAELYLRKPFFPGSNHIEQLKLIFHYLGTPDDLEWIKTPDAKRWVSQMPKKAPKDFKQIMNNINDHALELMLSMLTIDPRYRISVCNALNHSWLKHLRKDNDLRNCDHFDLSFEFEASINTLFGVRHVMYEELKSFEKNQASKLNKRKLPNKSKSTKIANTNANKSSSMVTITPPQSKIPSSTK